MSTTFLLRAAVPVAALLMTLPMSPAGATSLSPAVASRPSPAGVSIDAPAVMRIDRQDPPVTVTFRGVSREMTATVRWGDGSIGAKRGSCSPAKAAANRTGCLVVFSTLYTTAGQYTIVASSGRTRATAQLTVAEVPRPWTPPAGWVQPPGWTADPVGATFTPCQDVHWYLDRAGEPGDRVRMHDDIANVLGVLAGETGLTFSETTDPAAAHLTFRWDPAMADDWIWSMQPGWRKATISLSPDDPLLRDSASGLGMAHVEWPGDGGTWVYDGPARGWFVMRATMGALGLDPVADTNQLMNTGYFTRPGLGAGDLDGLHTMYKNIPCPPIPD